jgi:hypothetical protein
MTLSSEKHWIGLEHDQSSPMGREEEIPHGL